MVHVRTSDANIAPEDEANSNSNTEEVFSKEVFSDLTYYELTSSLLETLEKHELLKTEFDELKNSHESTYFENS